MHSHREENPVRTPAKPQTSISKSLENKLVITKGGEGVGKGGMGSLGVYHSVVGLLT